MKKEPRITDENMRHTLDLLSGETNSEDFPRSIVFPEKLKYAFRSLLQWSEAHASSGEKGHETSAALFINCQGEMDIRELTVGTPDGVMIDIQDLSQQTVLEAYRSILNIVQQWKGLAEMMGRDIKTKVDRGPIIRSSGKLIVPNLDDTTKDLEYRSFVILPEDFPQEVSLAGVIGVKGKRLLGSVHVHPSTNPPSPGDLYIFMSDLAQESMKAVLGPDNTMYLLCKTKQSILGDDTDEQRLDEDLQMLLDKGLSVRDARIQLIIKEALAHHLAFYVGNIEDNGLERVV